MSKLTALTQHQLDCWVEIALSSASKGQLPQHVPLLADPDRYHDFAVQVHLIIDILPS
jgi:hypothetical protein